MSELVQGQSLAGGRYVIARRLEPGVYLARPGVGEATCLIRDLGPSSAPERWLEAAQDMKGWSHPRLTRVLDLVVEDEGAYLVVDRPEGITLATLLSWRTEPPEDDQLVRWAHQLAEALAYLEEKRWPFPDRCLRLDHLTVSPGEELTVTFFGAEGLAAEEAGEKPAVRAQRELVRVLVRLAGGSADGEVDGSDMDLLPAELAFVAARARGGGFPTLKSLQEALLAPPAAVESTVPTAAERPPRARGPLELLLGQPLKRLGLELLLLFLAVLGIVLWLHTPPDLRRQAAVVVACGDVLVSVDPQSHRPLAEIAVDGEAQSMARSANGRWLFVAPRGAARVEVVDSVTGLAAGSVTLQQPADRLHVVGDLLVAALPQARLLTTFAFDGESSPDKLKLTPAGFLAAAGEAFSSAALPGQLAVAEGTRLTLYDLAPLNASRQRDLPLTVEVLAASSEGTRLAAGGLGTVVILEAATLEVLANLELESSEPLAQLLFAPDGKSLWALSREGRASLLSLETGDRLQSLWLDGPPGQAAFVSHRLWVPVPATSEVVRLGGSSPESFRPGPGPQAVLPLPPPPAPAKL